MARVKRAVHAKKHRKATLERAKGYYGNKSRSYRAANEQVQHSLNYAFRDQHRAVDEERVRVRTRTPAPCEAPEVLDRWVALVEPGHRATAGGSVGSGGSAGDVPVIRTPTTRPSRRSPPWPLRRWPRTPRDR